MEEVDGLFSSPEKSPDKVNGFDDEHDDSIGSDMSIEDGELETHDNLLPSPRDL
jgi:centromere protein C